LRSWYCCLLQSVWLPEDKKRKTWYVQNSFYGSYGSPPLHKMMGNIRIEQKKSANGFRYLPLWPNKVKRYLHCWEWQKCFL
jgi:hypothetical protein